MKPRPTTSPPRRSTRRTVAAAVPPVASTSSTIRTRLAGLDRVGVDLEQVGAVLEVVLLALDLPGQLAPLADGDEAGTETVGDGGGEDESPGLDPDHLGHPVAGEAARRGVDGESEAFGVGEERRDVLEDDPGLGKSGMSRMRSFSRETSGSTSQGYSGGGPTQDSAGFRPSALAALLPGAGGGTARATGRQRPRRLAGRPVGGCPGVGRDVVGGRSRTTPGRASASWRGTYAPDGWRPSAPRM